MVIVHGPKLPPKPCGQHIRDADLHDVAAHPAHYADVCVRIRGLVVGTMLFAGRRGYYLAGQGTEYFAVPGGTDYRVGLYMSDANWKRVRDKPPAEAVVIARVETCDDLVTDLENVLMVQGWCHYQSGTIFAVASIHTKMTRILRATSDADRADMGDLRFAPPDWDRRAAVTDLGESWMRAIEAGDAQTLRKLQTAYDVQFEPVVLRDAGSPFATFRGRKTLPQMVLFLPPTRDEHPTSNLYNVGVFCFCRSNVCDGLWPISTQDTGFTPERPYVCGGVWSQDGQLSVEISPADKYLTELLPFKG
ncbi:MAG TPA: hypothetical protein VNU97_14490 [Rhizomicrobium sp.]|nr:hypothetical protein [Rhizomicrobium sp.]